MFRCSRCSDFVGHWNIGPTAHPWAPWQVPRLAIGPTRAAAAKFPGQRSEHRPQTPVYQPPRAHPGVAARAHRNRSALTAPGGARTPFAAATKRRNGTPMRNIGARRARRRNPRGPGFPAAAYPSRPGGPPRAASSVLTATQRRGHCRRESGTSAFKPRMSPPIDEIKCLDIATTGHPQKPVQHHQAAPTGRAVMHAHQRRRSEPKESPRMCAYNP